MPTTPSLVGPSTVNVMPSGASNVMGCEPLLVALGDAHDHVVDQGAGQAVQRAALALVVGALDLDDPVRVLLDEDRSGHRVAERALGALDGHQRVVDGDVDTGRDRDGELADT
jgi:hypothetical protein